MISSHCCCLKFIFLPLCLLFNSHYSFLFSILNKIEDTERHCGSWGSKGGAINDQNRSLPPNASEQRLLFTALNQYYLFLLIFIIKKNFSRRI